MNYISSLTLTQLDARYKSNPAIARRYKLVAKIDHQIQLCSDAAYRPTRAVWVKNAEGQQELVNKAVRVQRWWQEHEGAKTLLVIRYGAKVLQLAEGKNAIELGSAAEVGEVLNKVRIAVLAGELDTQISAALGQRKLIFKSKTK